MLNRSASLAMSTSILKALPGKLDIKRHSPSILYIQQISTAVVLDMVLTKLVFTQVLELQRQVDLETQVHKKVKTQKLKT